MPAVDYGRLAPLYDALVTDTSDLRIFREAARRVGGPVVELMAGTGRLSVPLAEDGVHLTCVDSSPAMLAVLEAKLAARGARARIIRCDVRNLSLPECFELMF